MIATREYRDWMMATFAALSAEHGAVVPQRLAAQLLMLYDAAMVTAYCDGTPAPAQTAKVAATTLLDHARPHAHP